MSVLKKKKTDREGKIVSVYLSKSNYAFLELLTKLSNQSRSSVVNEMIEGVMFALNMPINELSEHLEDLRRSTRSMLKELVKQNQPSSSSYDNMGYDKSNLISLLIDNSKKRGK